MKANYLSLWALAGSASAYLATTTRYYDGQEGACGCGGSSGLATWQLGSSSTGVYTAAGSQALFDTDGSQWCGGGCGKCYNLTSTGTSACNGCGEGGVAGESIIVMVTNLCPYNGNEKWCPSVGAKNDYGYNYHFDIMAQNEVFGDNVVVNFEPVACPGQAASDWETCVCHGQTASDDTPAGFSSAAGSPEPAKTSSTSTVVPSSKTSTTLVAVSTSPVKEETSPAAAQPTSTAPSVPQGGAGTTSTYSLTITDVVTETVTVWATASETATSTSGSSAAVQTLYGRCGGIGWTGATTCASGATCKVQNPWYYQCVSSSQ